jgi:hypothetical protein
MWLHDASVDLELTEPRRIINGLDNDISINYELLNIRGYLRHHYVVKNHPYVGFEFVQRKFFLQNNTCYHIMMLNLLNQCLIIKLVIFTSFGNFANNCGNCFASKLIVNSVTFGNTVLLFSAKAL